MKQRKIQLFNDGDEQWACRFTFLANIDIDVVVTKVNFGYITTINVARSEYPDGLVLCDSLDQFDVYVKASENSGAVGVIDRNHIKLTTNGKPEMIIIYKFEFQLQYEGS